MLIPPKSVLTPFILKFQMFGDVEQRDKLEIESPSVGEARFCRAFLLLRTSKDCYIKSRSFCGAYKYCLSVEKLRILKLIT